jgi:NAD(P)H-hydrate epimerase
MGVKNTGAWDVLEVLPKRRTESHKGDYGRLLIVGGGSRYVGAPALAGLAALRSGVDLVTVAAPKKTAWAINTKSHDLITIKLPCKDLEPSVLPEVFSEMKKSTAIIVGPGLGLQTETKKAVLKIAEKLRMTSTPALFDADGLKALASKLSLARGMPWVLTPHAEEFKVLSGFELPKNLQARAQKVGDFAERVGCTMILKSNVDIISSPEGTRFNRTGNPGMTVGGTGDVLSGIVGAFLAQGVKPFKAAIAGAWASGRAGDMCYREKGYEFLASDVIDKLPDVFREVRRRK